MLSTELGVSARLPPPSVVEFNKLADDRTTPGLLPSDVVLPRLQHGVCPPPVFTLVKA